MKRAQVPCGPAALRTPIPSTPRRSRAYYSSQPARRGRQRGAAAEPPGTCSPARRARRRRGGCEPRRSARRRGRPGRAGAERARRLGACALRSRSRLARKDAIIAAARQTPRELGPAHGNRGAPPPAGWGRAPGGPPGGPEGLRLPSAASSRGQASTRPAGRRLRGGAEAPGGACGGGRGLLLLLSRAAGRSRLRAGAPRALLRLLLPGGPGRGLSPPRGAPPALRGTGEGRGSPSPCLCFPLRGGCCRGCRALPLSEERVCHGPARAGVFCPDGARCGRAAPITALIPPCLQVVLLFVYLFIFLNSPYRGKLCTLPNIVILSCCGYISLSVYF